MKEKIKDTDPPFARVGDFRRTPVVGGSAVGSKPLFSSIKCRCGNGRLRDRAWPEWVLNQFGLQPSPYRRLTPTASLLARPNVTLGLKAGGLSRYWVYCRGSDQKKLGVFPGPSDLHWAKPDLHVASSRW